MKKLNLDDVVVTNNEARHQFEAEANGSVAVSKYMLAGGRVIFTHTEVPPELEGQGVAGKLIRTALEHARTEGLAVWPVCPFVRSYLERHPEYQDLVS